MTQFLYDGDALVAEYDGANHLLRRYLHGPGADEPLLWLEGAGTDRPRWLHADHQGSIVAVSDASGNPLAIDAYDEYGVPGTQNQGRFQYTGQIWLPELGMYHYKARIYSPTLGRFLQTDPIGYKDQINLYAYVGDDPVNGKDPTGDFQEGTGFTDAQWKEFNKAQQQAAGDMDKEGRKAGREGRQDGCDAKCCVLWHVESGHCRQSSTADCSGGAGAYEKDRPCRRRPQRRL